MNYLKLFTRSGIGLIVIFSVFCSCEREYIDIEDNELIISPINLNVADSEVNISADLIASDFGTQAEVKITSDADPEGFTFSESIRESTSGPGGGPYTVSKSLETFVSVGRETDKEQRIIKVGKEDNVMIEIIGGPSKTVPFNGLHPALEYIIGHRLSPDEGTVKIYGFDIIGNEREAVFISTKRVPNPRLLMLEFDENSPGFNYFAQDFFISDNDQSFIDESSLDYYIGVFLNDDSRFDDVITIHYKDLEIEAEYGGDEHRVLLE